MYSTTLEDGYPILLILILTVASVTIYFHLLRLCLYMRDPREAAAAGVTYYMYICNI